MGEDGGGDEGFFFLALKCLDKDNELCEPFWSQLVTPRQTEAFIVCHSDGRN